jgi:hypothetical protein
LIKNCTHLNNLVDLAISYQAKAEVTPNRELSHFEKRSASTLSWLHAHIELDAKTKLDGLAFLASTPSRIKGCNHGRTGLRTMKNQWQLKNVK